MILLPSSIDSRKSLNMLYPALLLSTAALATAHTVAWTKGMYCFGGPDPSTENLNTNTTTGGSSTSAAVTRHPPRRRRNSQPPSRRLLNLTVELAHKRAQASFSYNGEFASEWPDGQDHSEDWAGVDGCVLPLETLRDFKPWYMAGYKCNVTGSTSIKQLAPAQPPVYCEDDATRCVSGAKQIIAWNQRTGNNVEPPSGETPMYNEAWGYDNGGAQNDIFIGTPSSSPVPVSSTVSTSTTAPSATNKPSKCRKKRHSHHH
ncbi:hypothetical protein BJX70DRAFT_402739 [Aspergillus crustosus]